MYRRSCALSAKMLHVHGILQAPVQVVYTLPCRHIHSTSQYYCNDDYKQKSTNRKSAVECDLESDWLALSNDESNKYKYWEVPVNEIKRVDSESRDFNGSVVNEIRETSKSSDDDSASEFDKISKEKRNQVLTHTDQLGQLNMVDIATKTDTSRVAVAVGTVFLGKEAFELVKENKMKKGDVLTVAKIAGITAAKRTSDLIPLCHNIPLSKVEVNLELVEKLYAIKVSCLAKTYGKTGVEMEAITAVAIATVTIYDMCKAVTKDMVIGDIRLVHKSGGKSGVYKISDH